MMSLSSKWNPKTQQTSAMIKPISIEEYRALPYLSYSRLKKLLVSPKHFITEDEPEETIAMRMGTAVDEYILSGKAAPHAIKPDFNPADPTDTWHGAKKWCKAWEKEQKDKGLAVYGKDDYEKLMAMQRALEESPEFKKLLELCPERQVAVTAEYRGVMLKGLLDLAGHDKKGRRCFGDLKSSASSAPREFARLAVRMSYQMQLALYSTLLGISEGLEEEPAMFWCVVESSKAAPVSVFTVPRDAIDSGMRKLDYCIDLYKECSENNRWPGYNREPGFMNLEWPGWDSIPD